MPRKPTPEGKREVWCVRLSDGKSAAADAARGETARAGWLESLIDAALGGVPAHGAGEQVQRKRPDPVAKPPSVALRAPAPARKRAAKTAERPAEALSVPFSEPVRQDSCPHPKARINKGLCSACGTYVGTGK